MPNENWYKMEMQANGTPTIFLYDVIGGSFFDEGTQASAFAKEFKAITDKNPKNIHVRINSPGGRVTDGTAIFSLLSEHKDKITVFVDGIAASIAALIAMAGNKRIMAKSALFMIHNPSGCACGNSEDMRAMADLMDKVAGQLLDRLTEASGGDREQIEAQMHAQTWFDAQEAVDAGFAHEISDMEAVAFASANAEPRMLAQALKGMPKPKIAAPAKKEKEHDMSDQAKAASLAELKAVLPGADADFILAQLEAKATETDALKAFTAEQDKRLETQKAETAKAEAETLKAKEDAEKKLAAVLKAGGVLPLESDADESENSIENPKAEWRDAIAAKVKQGHSRQRAVGAVVRENPELHAAYLGACNQGR